MIFIVKEKLLKELEDKTIQQVKKKMKKYN